MCRWQKCSVATCDRPALEHGLCTGHWSRVRHGGPLRPEIPIQEKTENENEMTVQTQQLENGEKLEGVLASITKGKVKRPVYILIYGVDGVGKSTFAAAAPNPVFVGTEAGSYQLEVARFPKAQTFAEFCAQLDGLATLKHSFRSVIIDTVDWLEPLVWQQVCSEGGVDSIENYLGGFGKGYLRAAELWRSHILSRFEILAERYHVILIGHAMVKTFNDPNQSSGYDRYQLKLNDKAAALLRESVDAVLFATYRIDMVRAKAKKENRAISDGSRMMFTENRPGFDAKNRFELPFEMPLKWEPFGKSVLAFYESKKPELPEQSQPNPTT